MILLGLDPGLQATGWGVIEAEGNRLRHVANGTVRSRAADPLADRLVQLYDALAAVIAEHAPASAAVEETFVNTNPQSTLKLGQARGVVMLVAAKAGLPVAEYAARFVKKAIVGARRGRQGAGRGDGRAAAPRLRPARARRGGCAGGGDHPRAYGEHGAGGRRRAGDGVSGAAVARR